MGEYVCIADNGVTPHKQMSFNVEVHCKSFSLSLSLYILQSKGLFFALTEKHNFKV